MILEGKGTLAMRMDAWTDTTSTLYFGGSTNQRSWLKDFRLQSLMRYEREQFKGAGLDSLDLCKRTRTIKWMIF